MISQSPFDENEFAARAARVRERMRADGLDAVIAYSNAKAKGCVRYLRTTSSASPARRRGATGETSSSGLAPCSSPPTASPAC